MPELRDDPDPDAPRSITGTITGPDTGPLGETAPTQRRLRTPSAVVLGAVAALLVAVLLVGRDSAEVPESAQVGDPSPSAERSDPVDPLLLPETGTPRFAGPGDVPVTVVLAPGWAVEDVFVSKDWPDGYGLAFYHVINIYADPCRWELLDPPVGPTVDDLTRALAESPAWQAGVPSDVVVDGHEGTHLTFTLPAYDPQDCQDGAEDGLYGLFKDDDPQSGGAGGNHPNLWALGPLQRNEVWILDVDGTRLVVLLATLPTTPPEDVADLWAMIASLQIGAPEPTDALPLLEDVPPEAPVPPGRYVVSVSDAPSPAPVAPVLTVPPGYTNAGGAGVVDFLDSGANVVWLWDITSVYTHPCDDGGSPQPVGPSVADLAAALAAQPMRGATEPTAVTVGGYDGLYLELQTPDDLDLSTCRDGYFHSWPGRSDQVLGAVDKLWILDVEGQRITFDLAHPPGATPEEVDELTQMVTTATFIPRGDA